MSGGPLGGRREAGGHSNHPLRYILHAIKVAAVDDDGQLEVIALYRGDVDGATGGWWRIYSQDDRQGQQPEEPTRRRGDPSPAATPRAARPHFLDGSGQPDEGSSQESVQRWGALNGGL